MSKHAGSFSTGNLEDMAAQRQRSRRSNRSGQRFQHVAPVLDPSWKSPYHVTEEEREKNFRAISRNVVQRRLVRDAISLLVAIGCFVISFRLVWVAVIGVIAIALMVLDIVRAIRSTKNMSSDLNTELLDSFSAAGTSQERLRLVTLVDRLCGTFGVDNVSSFIVHDESINATIVPNGPSWSLFVTSGALHHLELIELEGLVAHCLARTRTGVVARQVAASRERTFDKAKLLAGEGLIYRADEVAAAAIRYPLGLVGALRKAGESKSATSGYFASARYDQCRWLWFNPFAEKSDSELGNLDNVTLRAMALEEW
jgi:hypothetical protein